MRPLLPMVMLLAACGDNLPVDEIEEGPATVDEPGAEEPTARFLPDICSVRSWPSVAFADRDVDISVVPTAHGAAIFSVQRSGGPLHGFAIDGRGLLVGKDEGTVIRDDLAFTAVSAAYIDERLVTAAVSDGSVSIDMISDDFGARANLSTARGSVVADLPIAHGRASRIATVGDIDGLTAISFDQAWATTGTHLVTSTEPRSMTATRYLDDSIVAWSTDTTCHVQRVAAGVTSNRNFACRNNRIAVDPAARAGYMVFERDGVVMISDIRVGAESELANQRVLVSFASSPRIVFDGSRYWVSYINAREDVVVGYLQADGSLASMALEGTQPLAEGHELALVNNGVWVFAVDGAGVGAQRVCLKPIY
ncbi:MAG: hypothetical protein H0T89_36095 [Deltaproteobacteria bacterium]|nr:hypothetical protein [Deltaproteobacteria bacterium]MDQ3299462.1 hypothetical protein [Myxococcota bacterium]